MRAPEAQVWVCLAALGLALGCLILLHGGRSERPIALSVGVLTGHERELFRKYEMLHHLNRGARASKRRRMQNLQQSQDSSPGPAESGRAGASEMAGGGVGLPAEGSACEGCEARASSLPLYDHDAGEFLAAMQKQDKMINFSQKEREAREKAMQDGERVPGLLPVICGSDCFAAEGVWCCRMKKA